MRFSPWVAPALAVAALVNLPLVYIVLRAGEKGLAGYAATVASPLVGALLWRTVVLVGGTVLLTVAVALPAAWLVVRTDLPGRRAWAVLLALPLVFPSYVSALAWVAALGPRGYLRDVLAPLGLEALPAIAHGYSGALLTLGLYTYPYVFLPLVAALRGLDPALEESSRSLGAGRLRGFVEVVLPQLRGPIYAGSLLVALYVLSDLGAVEIVRYDTFTLAIFNAYRGLFDRSRAAILATVLVALTLGLIALEAALARRLRDRNARPSHQAPPVALGSWRWPAMTALGGFLAVTLGIPIGVVGVWGARGLALGHRLDVVGEAIVNSLSASATAAVAAMVLAMPIAIWSVRHRGKVARVVERSAYAGYALPGLVIALSLVFFAARYARPLYQTLTLLVVAYLIRFLPQSLAASRSALTAVPPSYEEAARSLGRSPLNVFWSLTLPLIMPGVLAGGALVFLTAMKELPATLLLRPIGFETLATEIWIDASEAIYSQAALPALALVVVTAPPVYWLVIRPVLKER